MSDKWIKTLREERPRKMTSDAKIRLDFALIAHELREENFALAIRVRRLEEALRPAPAIKLEDLRERVRARMQAEAQAKSRLPVLSQEMLTRMQAEAQVKSRLPVLSQEALTSKEPKTRQKRRGASVPEE